MPTLIKPYPTAQMSRGLCVDILVIYSKIILVLAVVAVKKEFVLPGSSKKKTYSDVVPMWMVYPEP